MSPTKKTPSTPLLATSLLTPDQQAAITRLYECDHTCLIGKMGIGKTIISITALVELFKENHLKRVLIVSTKKACERVWSQEHTKWEHTQRLNVAVALGNEKKRRAAVESDSDILVINYNNLAWLLKTYKDGHGCDGLLLDELSKMKDPSGVAFKAMRHRLKDFTWRVGLTGTPVSEDYVGLYGQMLMLDKGAALGTSKEDYLYEHFIPLDYDQRNWMLRAGQAEAIARKIAHLIHVMPDYRHELPPLRVWDEVVALPPDIQDFYADLARNMLVTIEDSTVEAQNAAVLTGKLAQVANGFLYDTEREETIYLHDEKLNAVRDLVNEIEGPVIIAYWYDEDKRRLHDLFNCPVEITEAVEDAWNAGKLDVLALHPRSAGHGLNLQLGGASLIWYGPQWSRDLYEQLIARLWRRLQTEAVDVYTIVAEGTIDEGIQERVDHKAGFDTMLLDHLKAIMKK